MQEHVAPLTLPVPPTPDEALPAWQVFRLLRTNVIETWPREAYDDMVVRRRLFGTETLIVSDTRAVRHILTGNAANYGRPVAQRRALLPSLGNGLIMSEGADWRRQRRTLAPTFTPHHVGLLLPHFADAAEGLLQSCRAGERINLSAAFMRTAVDAACRAMFSVPAATAGTGRLPAIMQEFQGDGGRVSIWDLLARTERDFPWFDRVRKNMAERWMAEIDLVIAARRRLHGDGAQDVMSSLLAARDPETGDALSEADIREQVANMLAGGFETTARTMFWTVYMLAQDRAAQDEVRRELAAFPPEAARTLADFGKWPALKRAMLEALRLYPPVPYISRVARAADAVGGEAIAAGSLVMICPWIIHRHRRLWDHPAAFLPARWLGREENYGENFLPFGAGPRICIGASFALAEIMVVLARLLARFEVSLDDDRPVLPRVTYLIVPSTEPWFRLEG